MSRALLCVCAVKIVGGGLLTICMHYLPCNVLLLLLSVVFLSLIT